MLRQGEVLFGAAADLFQRGQQGTAGVAHPHVHGARTRRAAFAIGLGHGMVGSAGVGMLVLASIGSTGLAVTSLALLAVFTAVSMSLLSSGFGSVLASHPARAALGGVAPALGESARGFGVWYAAAAWSLAPYPF